VKNNYRCDACGCYLDPGEGWMCDECLAEQQKKVRSSRSLYGLIRLHEGQYEINMEACENEYYI